MLIIPAIDLKDGKCVRLRQGLMDDSTIFSDNPVDMAEKWMQQGARRLHLVDLDGAFQGNPRNAKIINKIVKKFPNLPIQIGGGIRTIETIKTYLDVGVNYTIIGTKAVENPKFIEDVCRQFPDNIIVGLDAKNGMVATDGWAKVSEYTAVELAKKFSDFGVKTIIYTDIARDGMMQGVNMEATVDLAKKSGVSIIASGGITNMNDIKILCETRGTGVIGAITGRAIYEGTLDLSEAQTYGDKSQCLGYLCDKINRN